MLTCEIETPAVQPALMPTPLEWLSALLTELRDTNWPARTEDPCAAWDAISHSEMLVSVLRSKGVR